NSAGVRLARQAVENLKNKQAGEAWVAGSVGPLGVRLEPLGKTGLDEARAAFSEQMQILVDGGVDLLIVETMPALNAVEAMRPATTLPLVAMPNAGMPRAVEGRNIYLCSPEYMASFARKAITAGVQ